MPSARSSLLHREGSSCVGLLNCGFQLDKDGCSHQREEGLWGDLWSLTLTLLRWEETRSFRPTWTPFLTDGPSRGSHIMALPEGEEGGRKAVGVPVLGQLWGNGVHLGLLGTLSSPEDGLPASICNEQAQKAHIGSKGAQLPVPSPGCRSQRIGFRLMYEVIFIWEFQPLIQLPFNTLGEGQNCSGSGESKILQESFPLCPIPGPPGSAPAPWDGPVGPQSPPLAFWWVLRKTLS